MNLIPDDKTTEFPKQLKDFKSGDFGYGNSSSLVVDIKTGKPYLIDDVNFLFFNPLPKVVSFTDTDFVYVEKVGEKYIIDITMVKKIHKLNIENLDLDFIEVYDVITDVTYDVYANAFATIEKKKYLPLDEKEMVNRFLFKMYPNINDPDVLISGNKMLNEEKEYCETKIRLEEQFKNSDIFKVLKKEYNNDESQYILDNDYYTEDDENHPGYGEFKDDE